MAISSINTLIGIDPKTSFYQKLNASEDTDGSFSNYLMESLKKISDLQDEAKTASEDFAVGKTDNIHQVMITGEKAEVALQYILQIRNKVLDAYNEIMRTQI